ncbi:hypothetical protein GCM10008955_31090 [Deinococcus malanensis]|uniref:Serine/threonine protein kinase n=1 Tax=Deinococcus malanensis TaxID=1706855 RepID=A0ABQ2F321_9DEIO|nr:DUF5946 family protein [Deinococcus malanensis]GGK34933.1 hypothetical protein GCM10008955_31090 [Deinococcus malanensis]
MDAPSPETCVGCGAVLPRVEGPVHRYMTSSPACWAAFNVLGSTRYSLADVPFEALLVDAYAVQHPGTPSNQAINSVAIHLMVLYGVIVRGYAPDQAQRLRQRPGQQRRVPKHERFFWLTPPSFASVLTVADVLSAADVQARADVAEAWVRDVWSVWAQLHEGQVAAWFAAYMAFE